MVGKQLSSLEGNSEKTRRERDSFSQQDVKIHHENAQASEFIVVSHHMNVASSDSCKTFINNNKTKQNYVFDLVFIIQLFIRNNLS